MYDVNYFIQKFEAIPEENWTVEELDYGGKSCALGHCGVFDYVFTSEALALSELFKNNLKYKTTVAYLSNAEIVYFVNDGNDDFDKLGSTPKKRILACLYDIRDKELSEANVIEASKILNEVDCNI